MHYSLFSRFQGCLLGMVLGEWLGAHATSSHAHPQNCQLPSDPNQPLRYSSAAFQLVAAIVATPTWEPTICHPSEIIALGKSPATDAALAIATLPIAQFYHDDLNRQRRALWQAIETVQQDDWAQGWITVFAYAIAQAIKGHLDPQTLIDQSQAYLRVAVADKFSSLDQLINSLDQIKTLQDSLEKTSHLNHPIAIAIACFLYTPGNLPLALLRARRLTSSPSITALTGALCGAYNGAISIPANWKTSLKDVAGIPSLQQIQTLTMQLLATWSGVYTPSSPHQTTPPPVAAPWVMHFP